MNTETHPIEQEELMAHLDGELPGDRVAVVAAHLDSCDECRQLAEELKSVSQGLEGWQVELTEAGLFQPVATEVAQKLEPARRSWFESYLISWGVPAAVFMIIVVGTIRLVGTNDATSPQPNKQFDRLEQFSKLQQSRSASSRGSAKEKVSTALIPPAATPSAPGEALASAPMIVRTAAVELTVQDFDKARSHLDEILARHRGYLGGLQISTPSNQGRVLNGVLRIPVGQMDSALAALKNLGHVDSESQKGEEVTAQYIDLQARLANARHTEQRLTEVLQQRTGKLSDVLAVETEIARVRGEIESMEAERKSLATQVAFATLNVTLTEEYKPQLQTVPPSTFRQFRNSAVEGYQTMAAGVIALVNTLLYYGPSMLLWAALAVLPARFVWRRLTAKPAHGPSGAAS